MPIPQSDDMTIAAGGDYGDETEVKCFQVGDGIVGVVSSIRTADTKFGQKRVATFTDVKAACSDGVDLPVSGPSEAFTLWATPALASLLDQKQVDVGSQVTIAIVELVDTGKGNPFKQFGLIVHGTAVPTPPAGSAPTEPKDPFAA